VLPIVSFDKQWMALISETMDLYCFLKNIHGAEEKGKKKKIGGFLVSLEKGTEIW